MTKPKFTYIARPIGKNGPVKIGCSVNPETRLRQFRYEGKGECEIVATIPGAEWERRLHVRFLDQRVWREWFDWSPELQEVIDGIRAGTFDLETLPPIQRLPAGFRSMGPPRSRGRLLVQIVERPVVETRIKVRTRVVTKPVFPDAYLRRGRKNIPLRYLTLEAARAEADAA